MTDRAWTLTGVAAGFRALTPKAETRRDVVRDHQHPHRRSRRRSGLAPRRIISMDPARRSGHDLDVVRLPLYAVFLAALSGCVIGRATRPSLNESAQGPLAAPVSGSPVVPQTSPEDGDAPPDKGKPGATWVRGYWHWDGVRYVWQRGRYQDDATAESTTPARAQ